MRCALDPRQKSGNQGVSQGAEEVIEERRRKNAAEPQASRRAWRGFETAQRPKLTFPLGAKVSRGRKGGGMMPKMSPRSETRLDEFGPGRNRQTKAPSRHVQRRPERRRIAPLCAMGREEESSIVPFVGVVSRMDTKRPDMPIA